MGASRAERRRMMRATPKNSKAPMAGKHAVDLAAEEKRLTEIISKMQTTAGAVGYTLKDVDDAYQRGLEQGVKHKGLEVIEACYAGICITLHDLFGFGEKRCFRAIEHLDQKIEWALNNAELAEEALAKSGIEIDFTDIFDRIQSTGGH